MHSCHRVVSALFRAFLLTTVIAGIAGCGGGGGEGGSVEGQEPLLQEAAFDANWHPVGVFSSATDCTTCHQADAGNDVMVFEGTDVSPKAGWENSMMALAFADPYFQAAVEEEVTEFPHLAGLIEDTCLTCHAPMARTHAKQNDVDLDEDGFYRFSTALGHMHAREGISCTACHQIQDDGLGTAESFSGGYKILSESDWADLSQQPEIYGPYDSPQLDPMATQSNYDPAYGPHMSESAMCATCHELFTPTIERTPSIGSDALPTGGFFPEQTPFQEWQNSVYGPGGTKQASCQDCHMPAPDSYSTQIAVRPNGQANLSWPSRAPFHTHGFVGGNTHTLEILLAFRSLLGIEGFTSVEGLEAQIEATRAQLENDSAELAIEQAVIDGSGQLEIDIRVTNKTGHKLPTSYPSRRVWLHVKVTDGNGAVVFESGKPDAEGRISTDAAALQTECLAGTKAGGFDYTRCYEPHRDTISDPSEVAIYESVLGDTDGHITYHLLYAAEYLKDNRIPPEGFDIAGGLTIDVPGLDGNPVTVNGVSKIAGDAASDDDFNAEASGQDLVHYLVNTNGYSGSFTVEARLLYQSVRPGFVYGLHHDDQPRVARYKQMYEMLPPPAEVLATASQSVP